jgi:hypothetical protein
LSYIAFDLDALNVARDVGAAAGVPEERITHGLLRMWAWCFREKTDTVQAIQVQGFFGVSAGPALVAFGFLEASGETYRVRGAEKYLRLSESRSKAGRVRSSGAGRSAGRFTSTPPAQHQHTTSTPPALTPSTHHLAPSTQHLEEAEAPLPPVNESRVLQFDVVAPEGDPEAWTKEDFWRWAEATRRKAGCPVEKWPSPVALGRWWTEARAAADVAVLQEAFLAFGDDPHWQRQRPALPWAGFAKQWNQYLPMRSNHVA